MNILDFSIFVISVLGIFLEMYQKPLFWLTYIVASILLGYELIHTQLYGSALIQLIYIVLSIYGWYKWTVKNPNQQVKTICHITPKQIFCYTIATVILTIIFHLILKHIGDSHLSDAILTAMCIVATYMSILKQIESWFLFASTVVISIPLCYSAGLYFTVVTYIVFGILDLIGGVKWLFDYKNSTSNNQSV